jgi:hypothetical protein
MNQKAVRSGNWKLIVDGAPARMFLFDVKRIRVNAKDWIAGEPEIVRRRQSLLAEWERDVAPRRERSRQSAVRRVRGTGPSLATARTRHLDLAGGAARTRWCDLEGSRAGLTPYSTCVGPYG